MLVRMRKVQPKRGRQAESYAYIYLLGHMRKVPSKREASTKLGRCSEIRER